MLIFLVIVTICDVALGILLLALSGFALQGVNNIGPIDGAWFVILILILCFVAPVLAWVLRVRIGDGWSVLLALVPVTMFWVAMMLPA